MRKLMALSVSLVFILILVACSDTSGDDHVHTPDVPEMYTLGDTFLSSGFKIRTEMKMKQSVSTYPLIFEIYVDGDGDGAGLVGYRDNVYDVYLVGGQVYVVVSDDVTVHITDINSHMVPTDLRVAGNNDLKTIGFAVLENQVVSYSGGNSNVDMVSKYEGSVSTFDPVAISQANNMTTSELLKYFFEADDTSYVETPTEVEQAPTLQSFYVDSEFGVVIRGTNYSLGDYCEPYTYFESMIPQGMNTTEDYRQDEKVIFTYVSYLSSDGSSTFMTTDGYVQAISTTSDFTFIEEIYKGMSDADLKAILGIGLKKAELEEFEPLYDGLTASKINSGYKLEYGDLTVELEVDNKTKTLAAITLTNYLDFRS